VWGREGWFMEIGGLQKGLLRIYIQRNGVWEKGII
jgi:hypothetical protein